MTFCRTFLTSVFLRPSVRYFSTIRVVSNNFISEEPINEFTAYINTYSRTHFDLGTGDGRLVYDLAKKDPSTMHVGVDSTANQMAHYARKATRKPSKGGLEADNLRLVLCNVDDLPNNMEKVADKITIVFPWGSLLKSVTEPSKYTFGTVARLAKPDARLTIVLNRSIYDDKPYLKKLGLQDVESTESQMAITRSLEQSGFHRVTFSYPTKPEFKTSWGQRLTLGSARNIIQVDCLKT